MGAQQSLLMMLLSACAAPSLPPCLRACPPALPPPTPQVLAAAKSLQQRGAAHVLVTLAERGSLLLGPGGSVLRQAALPPPGGSALDATAAGDAFRAAFGVALAEGRPPAACLQFAAAAGAIAVSRLGAVPSLPTRAEVEALLAGSAEGAPEGEAVECGAAAAAAAGGGVAGTCSSSEGDAAAQIDTPAQQAAPPPAADCPLQFASRLNSMAARRDLAGEQGGSDDGLGWIKRQVGLGVG